MKKTFNILLLTLICFLIAPKAHSSDAAFERIKNSLPQREAGWKIVKADGPVKLDDGSRQASFIWTNGKEEVSATVILCKSLNAAKEQFKRSPKTEPSMDAFLIDGIGDQAYLFPPIIHGQTGPFNLRCRKARYEILMNAPTKETIKRCAKYVVEAIAKGKSTEY